MAKKKTVGKLGAGVLAATTVISGLGFGIMPAGAATETKASSTHQFEVGDEGAHLQLISKTDTGYSYFSIAGPYGSLKTSKTLAEAEKDALEFTAHFAETIDGRPYWQLRTSHPNFKPACLTADGVNFGAEAAGTLFNCKQAEGTEWTMEDGALKANSNPSKPGWPWLASGSVVGPSGFRLMAMSTTRPEHTFVGLPSTLAGLSADVQDVDLEAGTALLDGVAPDDATDVEVTYLDKDSKKKTYNAAAKDGKWSQALSALALGNTSVHLKAYNGAELIAESDVDVDLPVTPLSVQPELSEANVEAVAKLTGSASKNTTIKVKSGTKQVATTMTGEDGSFEVPVNAPNAAGDYELTATQEIRDEDATPQDVTIPYGAGVAVSSPEDGAELDAGQPLVVSGTAQTNSLIRVYEKGNPRVVLGQATATNGYRIVLNDLEDREYQLVVAGVSKGNNVTTAEVTVNPGEFSLAPIDGSVTFPGALGDQAHVVGTAEKDIDISIKNGDDEVATGKANGNGAFDIPIPSQGPGQHTLTLTETKDNSSKSTDVVADFGAAVTAEVDGSSTIAGSSATVTGTGADDARIVVSENGKTVAEGTVRDGEYSLPIEKIQDGEHAYVVTQTAKGNTTSTAQVTITRDAPVTEVTLTSPKSGDTYPARSTVRFEGTGTPGAKVVLDAFFALADFETTVDYDGKWHIDRPMNVGTYEFDVVQTAKGDKVSRVDGIELTEEGLAVDRPFAVTAPANGSQHKDEMVTFSGTGTPDSTISLDPKNPALATVTTTVKKNGLWEVNRYLGTGAYEFDIIQAKGGSETGRTTIRVNQSAAVTKPFAVTSPEADSTHKNETVRFAGTGAAGSTITLDPKNPALATLTTTVKDNGDWEVNRYLGSGVYEFEIRQTTNGQLNGSATLHLNGEADPVNKDFAVTSHQDGDTFTPNSSAVFRGTGTAGAQVVLDPGAGLAKVTTEVKRDGNWEVTKYLGNGKYTFTPTQTVGGSTTTFPAFTITPTQ